MKKERVRVEEKNGTMREGGGVAWGRGFERATERRKCKFTYIYIYENKRT
jgi:hypothetical protein